MFPDREMWQAIGSSGLTADDVIEVADDGVARIRIPGGVAIVRPGLHAGDATLEVVLALGGFTCHAGTIRNALQIIEDELFG